MRHPFLVPNSNRISKCCFVTKSYNGTQLKGNSHLIDKLKWMSSNSKTFNVCSAINGVHVVVFFSSGEGRDSFCD